MANAHDHSKHIDTWMKEAAKGLPPHQLLQLFEQTMNALWDHTHRTLGSVTLGAVTDRVLVNASERFSPFESLKVETKGIDFRELRERPDTFDDPDALTEGIRFVVVEFISVLGNLTGGLLTPGLYSELSKITLRDKTLKGNNEGESS